MENSGKKRLGAGAALLFLGPALVTALSGCNDNCDRNRSTLTTSDDCGTGRRSSGGYFGGGALRSGRSSGQVAPRSGGFGGFGRIFSGGG